MPNELKIKALDCLHNAIEQAVFDFQQYEKTALTNENHEFKATLERIWMDSEERVLAMRRMYNYMFNEFAPRTRTEIEQLIESLT